MPEFAIRPQAPSAVARCAADDAELLQSMADDGLSRQVIADLFGVSKRTVNYWLKAHAISTTGRSPLHEVHGTRGDKPPKLAPEMHQALTVLAECAQVDIGEFVELVVQREVIRRVHEASVIADKTSRLGSSGISRDLQGVTGK